LAFFRRDKLYLINRDGSGLQCIYEHALKLKEDDSNYLEWMNSFKLYFSSSGGDKVTWSPNGKYLAFAASRTSFGAEPGIYRMNLATKEINLLTVPDSIYQGADWSP
jgi:Tol biopolymer transport system component